MVIGSIWVLIKPDSRILLSKASLPQIFCANSTYERGGCFLCIFWDVDVWLKLLEYNFLAQVGQDARSLSCKMWSLQLLVNAKGNVLRNSKLEEDDELPEYLQLECVFQLPLWIISWPNAPWNCIQIPVHPPPSDLPSFKCQEQSWDPTTAIQYPPHSQLLTSIGNSASHN